MIQEDIFSRIIKSLRVLIIHTWNTGPSQAIPCPLHPNVLYTFPDRSSVPVDTPGCKERGNEIKSASAKTQKNDLNKGSNATRSIRSPSR